MVLACFLFKKKMRPQLSGAKEPTGITAHFPEGPGHGFFFFFCLLTAFEVGYCHIVSSLIQKVSGDRSNLGGWEREQRHETQTHSEKQREKEKK